MTGIRLTSTPAAERRLEQRSPVGYEPPALSVLGTLAQLTLGGTTPVSDGTAGAS
ncbi:MAG: lasso RiPP family leader peptide-containing protein [Solirubrobacteraceae bacterium]